MSVTEIFQDEIIISKIQTKLPELFQLAELESSRAGKIGMEVGSVRERILIALLILKFGTENVRTDLSIHEPEVDVIVMGNNISIKTLTGKRLIGIKLSWTVDRDKVLEFARNYEPKYDMILAHINWDGEGGLHYFRKETQMSVLGEMGRMEYIKLPKPGTNPRGVEISTKAIRIIAKHSQSMKIPIEWKKKDIEYDPYKRWLDHWTQD